MFVKSLMKRNKNEENAVPSDVPSTTEPKHISFDICTGEVIGKRDIPRETLRLVLSNTDQIWAHCVKNKPLLLALVETLPHDQFLFKQLKPIVSDFFPAEEIENNYEFCLKSYLEICVTLLCVCTSTEATYRLLKHSRFGSIIGAANVTAVLLNMDHNPIPNNVQLAMISNVVWHVGYATYPSMRTRALIETLGLFKMQDDDDLQLIITNVMNSNQQIQCMFN